MKPVQATQPSYAQLDVSMVSHSFLSIVFSRALHLFCIKLDNYVQLGNRKTIYFEATRRLSNTK